MIIGLLIAALVCMGSAGVIMLLIEKEDFKEWDKLINQLKR